MSKSTKADIAIINGGGIRAERIFPAGPLTKRDIMDALPFTNYVEKLEITGDQLFQALENGVSQIESGAGRYPQVSGIQFVYNPKLTPGARVLDVKVNGQALDRKARYTISVVDFVAEGGDGYDIFKGSKVLLDKNAGPLLSEAVIDYIGQKRTVAPSAEGRIQISDNTPNNLYSDLNGQPYETVLAAMDLQNKGVILSKNGENQFQPEKEVTAGQFAEYIGKALNLQPFEYKAAGLQEDEALTREQMVAILARALRLIGKLPAADGEAAKGLMAFADHKQLNPDNESDWAAVTSSGLIRGKADLQGNAYLAPGEAASRAQTAIVIERLLQLK